MPVAFLGYHGLIPGMNSDLSCDTAAAATHVKFGTPQFRHLSLAMFALGLATFSLLHGMQPLLPAFSQEFHIPPAQASGVVSAAAIALALLLIPAGVASDRLGRKSFMLVSLLAASLLSVASAFAHSFWQVLVLRALTGCALAGLPAVAMAYLGEEVAPDAVGRAVGRYFAGNAIGGLTGRLLASALGDVASWRVAIAVIGLMGFAVALLLARQLPPSRHFQPSGGTLRDALRHVRDHWRNRELMCLFGVGFLLMGCFSSVYNYLGYWLVLPPFELRPLYAGWVFLFYLLGSPTSIKASQLAERYGPLRMLLVATLGLSAGLLLMLSLHLSVLVAGLALFTVAYFIGYAIAGGWVTRKAGQAKASATSLYLCFFYAGGSIIGSGSGLMWSVGRWHSVVMLLLGLMLLLALLLWCIRSVSAVR